MELQERLPTVRAASPETVTLAFLCLVSLCLRLFFVSNDIGLLIEKFLVDDAYYAYAIARNIAAGEGIVFNSGIPTNGFQPLYVFLLVPIFELTYGFGINVPIYVSLVFLSVCSVLTAVFLYGAVASLTGRVAGLFAAFVWLFNPNTLFDSLMGLETPIQALLVSVLVWYVLRFEDRTSLNARAYLFVGIVSGLAMLSRLDSVFLVGSLYLSLALSHVRGVGSDGSLRDFAVSLRPLFASGTVASLVVSPWLAWSLVGVGRLTPVSGAATRELRRPLTPGDSAIAFDQAVGLVKSATPISVVPGSIVRAVGGPNSLLFVAVAATVLVLSLVAREQLRRFVTKLDFLLFGTVVYHLFYIFYVFGYRPWYPPYTHFVTVFLSAICLHTLFGFVDTDWIDQFELRTVGFLLLVCVYAFSFVTSGVYLYERGASTETPKWEAAQYIDEELPDDARVGSFNTGILQYYTPDHDVVNLDGVVNPQAYRAMHRGETEAYIYDRKIRYLVDRNQTYETRLSGDCELRYIEQFERRNEWTTLLSQKTYSQRKVYHLVEFCSASPAERVQLAPSR